MFKLTSSVTRSKAFLMLTLVLITAVLVCVAFVGGAQSDGVAYAIKDNDATPTYLSSDGGVKFGRNNLSVENDFYVSGGTGSSDVLTINAGSFASARPAIKEGRTQNAITGAVPESGCEVYYALNDKDTVVSAMFSATFYTEKAVQSDFKITLTIAYYEGATNEYFTRTVEFPVSANSGNAYNGELSVSTTVKPDQYDQEDGSVDQSIGASSGSHFYVKIDNGSSDTAIKMKAPQISLSSETVQQSLDMNTGIQLEISGKNRKTVLITDAMREGALDNVYVKTGDTITLVTSVNSTYVSESNQTTMTGNYGAFYNASLGRAGESCIDWYSVMENSSGSTTKTCLTRATGQTAITYPVVDDNYRYNIAVYYGFSASFTVGASSANGRAIRISPRLIQGYDENGKLTYWSATENEITIKLDNSIPEAPVLDPTKTLGLAIENGVWYTAGSSFTLDYKNGNDSYDNRSSEFVYAMIVSKDFTSLMTDYDFTPYSTQPITGDYSYRVGNSIAKAKRQELGDFSLTKTSGKNRIEFEENGEYGLVLYAVDEAGNVSSANVYAYNTNRQVVKVDASVRNVGANFLYNSTTIIPSKSNVKTYNKYAYAYICVGSEYHDESGNFKSKYEISKTDTTNAGQSANEGYIAVKRGTWVTIRIILTEANAADYALIRFHNNLGMSRSDPEYSVGRDNCLIYDLTFQMTDSVWNSTAVDFPISVTFNRRVDLRMSTDEDSLVYTKLWDNPEVLKLLFEAYFAKGDETVTVQPEIGVEYYNTATYYIYANFATLEDETISLTTGGRIEINGTTYDFGDDEDLRDYIAGRKSFITSDVYGEHEYIAYGKSNPQGIYTDPETGNRYQLYAVTGYDIASKQTTGVTDAGTYYYRAYVVTTAGTLPYYGEETGSFEVKKADPGVLNLAPKSELTYGQSLGELSFSSTKDDGTVITETTVAINGKVYQMVASGVYGEFVITSPQPGSDDYVKHDVISSYKIDVQFNPLDVTSFSADVIEKNYDQFFKNYYERVTDASGNFVGYALISGKQTASNYSSVTYEVTVTINHKFAYVSSESGTEISATYDGTPKEVTPYVYTYVDGKEVALENVPIIVEYKLTAESDSSYSVEAPTVAGRYDVRMRIDDANANYVSDATVVNLNIYQRDLTIIVEDSDAHSTVEETSERGYTYTDTLTYTYGLETTSRYTAGYNDESGIWIPVDGLEYALSFVKLYSFGATGDAITYNGGDWTESVTVVSPKYLDAGIYILRVSVVNVNNSGSKDILFTVNQVRLGDATNLTVSTPTAKTNYYNVPLSGKTGEKSGHLEYGQTLSEMRDAILGNGGSVKFTPRGTGVAETVSGRFYFETETEYAVRKGNSSLTETNTAGDAILPVKYNEKGEILAYDVNMYWQAGTYDEEGNFIPDYNFRRESFGTNVYVVRAKANFDDYRLENIVYGQRVSETYFTGSIVSNGYVFGEDDFTISVKSDYTGLVPDYGENKIICSFTPSEELLRRYVPIDDVNISLFVHKRGVSVEFATSTVEADDFDGEVHENAVVFVYGNSYTAPTVTKSAIGIDGLDVSSAILQYSYYRELGEGEPADEFEILEIDGNRYVKINTIGSDTPVGKYYVLAEVVGENGNFTGTAFNALFVIKATLYYSNVQIPSETISYGENINSVDFGKVSVVNSITGMYSKEYSGQFRLAVKKDGEFIYDYVPSVTTTEEPNVYVIFVPADEAKAGYEANCHPYIQEYFLRVNKHDISDTITIKEDSSYDVVVRTEEDVEIVTIESVFDDRVKNIKVFVPDPANANNQEGLAVTVSYTNLDGDKTLVPKKAGQYLVHVTVDTGVNNYSGSKTYLLTIKQAELTIHDDEISFAYTGKTIDYARPLDCEIDVVGYDLNSFEYDITFYAYNNDVTPMSGKPADIGKYYAEVKLVHADFKAQKKVAIYVTPVVSGYSGLETAYREVSEVTPIFEDIRVEGGVIVTHPSVNYTVAYKQAGDPEENYSKDLPQNAGKYDVRITYAQNGYDKTVDLEMTVAKAQATMDLRAEYYLTYNGMPVNFGVELPAGVTVAHYTFREGTDDFTDVAPTEAGAYDVRIELIDNNYEGFGTTVLVVKKATLDIVNTPVIDGKIEFGTSKEDVKFIYGSGSVKFPATGEEFNTSGEWSLEADISTLRVSTWNAQKVKFTPDDTRNFEEVTTSMQIVIQKRDISEYIGLADKIVEGDDGKLTITYPYTSKGVTVTPVLSDDADIMKGFNDITFAVYYNKMSNAPVSVLAGGYSVRIVVNSENYEGVYENENLRLVIAKATPIVNPPTIKDIKLGEPFDSSYLGSDGMAYIMYGDVRITVSGTFTVVGEYNGMAFQKANEQKVALMFTPSDTESFHGTVIETTVNVIGESYTVTEDDFTVVSKDGNPVIYGAPLSDYIIAVADGSELNGNGTFEWVNPDKVLHVGEKAEYKFVPNDTDRYNVTYGTTEKAVITQATLTMNIENSTIELYYGYNINQAVMALDLKNKEHPETAIGDYVATIVKGTRTVAGENVTIDLNAPPANVDPGNYLDGEFELSITSPDYQTEGNFTVKIYYVKHIEVFFAEKTGKIYDGEAVTVEDMRIRVADAIYDLGYDCFNIVSVTLNGKEVDEIRLTGTYTVTVEVAENAENGGAHRGTYTFEYTISKKDISDSIGITNNEPNYSETAAGASATFEGYTVSAGEVVYAYYSYDKVNYLGSQPPTNAGSYKVVATISDSNPYYTGSKEFDYIVNKLQVTVTLEPQYNFVYGNKIDIVPEIDGVASSAVTFTYQASGYAYATEITPTDAGTYKVTATVSDVNLAGSATATLVISKASVTSIAPPTVSALTYGKALRSAKFSGGSVESANGSDIIEGTYEFKEPDKTDTPVGENTISVRFIPNNKNYEELELSVLVTVNKAEIAVEVGKTEVYYNGEAQTPEVLSDVKVRFAYERDGLVVSSAVEAGNYTVTLTVDDANYTGTTTVLFTIKKAVVIEAESEMPVPADITYGRTLSTGVISGGKTVYVSGKSAINGKFTYVHGDTVLGDVGTYNGVEVVFTPYDTDNYELYYTTLTVKVAQAIATIKVSECTFVYGDTITKPVFETSPAGLSVSNEAFDTEMYGQIKDSATYEFTAKINHKNYTGSVLYQVVIQKKTVGVAYYSDDALIDAYNAQYGAAKSAKAHILDTDFVGSDSLKSAEIEKYMSYRYYSVDGGAETMINPTAVGDYKVYTVLDHNNYTVDKTASTINYHIVKADIKSVTFDSTTLSNQIYGSVVTPKVYTDPVGVGYRLEFPGYSDMPTSAGSYNIKVIIDDPNYKGDTVTAMFRINPKEISTENLKAYGKPADGLASIKVTGDLKGVMRGDEVSITFEAETEGGVTNAGTYSVVIKSWKLSGLHAGNYTLRDPIYKLSATITNRTIRDTASGAYITSSAGFSDNVTLEVSEIYDVVDQTNFFTSLIGQEASVQKITLKDCGLPTVLSQKIKFYVQIPEKYRDAESLTIKGRGGLEDVTFEREGDYVSFYADCSGEVLFYVNEFPYWIIIVAGAILILIIGVLLIIFVSPVRRRKRIPAGARKAHDLGNSVKGYDVKYERKMRAKKEEQKRRWKY